MKKNAYFVPILAWIACCSFFWNADEEKQLRNLHQAAESAMQKNDYESAKEAYAELIERIDVNSAQKYPVDWTTYVDAVIRFSSACEALGEIAEGELALSKLLSRSIPPEFFPQIKLMRARLTSHLKSPGDAFLEMQSVINQYAPKTWKKEDLSFFYALEYSLDSHFEKIAQKAKRYLVTSYYSEAIALYEEILCAIEANHYPKALRNGALIKKKISYRLAECHYKQANYEQTLALCYNSAAMEDRIDREMLYLSALCHREKREYEKALTCFQSYAHSGSPDEVAHYDHALLEIGLFYFHAGNFEAARRYFTSLQKGSGKPQVLARLYLARMHLQEGNPREVERNIAPLAKALAKDDPLRYECNYLRGEAAYAAGEFSIAKTFFERALPSAEISGEWCEQALFHLGWCYVHLGDQQRSNFKKGEDIFAQLYEKGQNEKAALALAQTYLIKWHRFHDHVALSFIDPLLSPLTSLEALLLRAEAAQGYEEKEHLYTLATDTKFKHEGAYAEGWYGRGLNHFQEGLKQKKRETHYFHLAATAFRNSFAKLEANDPLKSAEILKLEAKADAYRNSPLTSLALLEQLLKEFNESVEDREETLYLRGLIASRLHDDSYFSIAEESLFTVADGKGKYHDEALYALGALYFEHELYRKAKETFLRLAVESSYSSYAGEAWFWAAEAAENLNEEHATLHAHVYEDYPTCEKAPEAYFRQFSFEDYLEGEATAHRHLRSFTSRFPHSPLLVVVHYLIGLNEPHFERAKAAFEEAIKAFPRSIEEGKTPDTPYVYFRYQAILELAQLHLDHDLDRAQHYAYTIVDDFSETNHPLASLLMRKSPYPSIYEEGEFTLVETYLKKGKNGRAQERLAQMLTHYEEADIEEGYFLAQVWKTQGELAMQCQDHDTALECLEIAAACGEGYLSEDQMLELWMTQSNAHRGKQEYDLAMRCLSRVINTECSSPLRFRAMFFRAELYELQGRPELAIRQLEAMAKKGGDWASQASEKLRQEYGM